jgi:hypothetical protein
MTIVSKRFGVVALAVMAWAAAHPAAYAQFPFNPYGNAANPYVAQQQFMSNMQLAGGFNNPFAMPAAAAANPYTPVGAGYGAGVNPYSPVGAGGYAPAYSAALINPYNPFLTSSPGFTLMGQADVIRAYSTALTSQEQARVMRQQYYQAKLDTQKRKFELEMYIKANTPTFTEEQQKIAAMTLKRLQTTNNQTEIFSAKSLNVILDDLRRTPGKKVAMDKIDLSEDQLRRINVTGATFSLGILRDNGKFSWPTALEDMLTAEQKKEIEVRAQTLVQNSVKGRPDPNMLKDLRVEIEKTRENLLKKVNEIPGPQYLEAKRFLNDFDDARVAIERGEAANQLKFQEFVIGGKTVQEIADFLVAKGLRIAPATQGDEAAYQALNSAMVALDVAMNNGPAPDPEKN